jgi:hypothetical protein
VPRPRIIALALGVLLLHGLARGVDRALGLVLRAQVEPAGVLTEVARAMAAEAEPLRILAWVLAGGAAWVALGMWRARRADIPPRDALAAENRTLGPLLLRPALTALALISVVLDPLYPYGFTLPVALTQDLGIAQDVAALAALLALRLPPVRIKAPSAGSIFLLSFLAYALLTPAEARRWEGHPGNEPKYLRMGVALGQDLTFDAEGVSAAMEDLPTRPLGDALASAVRTVARESWRMARAVIRGEAGQDAIRASRITRQTIRGKDGGVYYVLAPGPSILLAPTFRVDRALNRSRGVAGDLVVTVLAWNALGALLVTVLFLLIRDTTSRPGLAALVACTFALLPPFLFYPFQFYPEMPGAIVLAVAFLVLALKPGRLEAHPGLMGLLLATLPWLHQKFIPVWLVLVVTALIVIGTWWRPRGAPRAQGWRDIGAWLVLHRRWLLAFLLPQAVSLYMTALYNFAITGSVRPDALFLAWGPGGVTTARVGQGLLGLLLDARYGILPYVPLFTLAVAGLVVGGARRFGVVLPAAAVYYLTVASADNWAGAVCNLGRYFMPVAPLAVALVAVALIKASRRRGAVAVALILAGWSALYAVALWNDPHAANDSALLLAKSAYADGNDYIPNLHLRRWANAAPGLWARVFAWMAVIGAGTAWWRRAAAVQAGRTVGRRRNPGASALGALAGTTALLLAGALILEQWPRWRASPSFRESLAVGPEGLLFVEGTARVRPDEVIVGPGSATLLLRAPRTVERLAVTVGGEGTLRVGGLHPLVLRPTGTRLSLPLDPDHVVHARGGGDVAFSRARVTVEGQAVLRPEAFGSPLVAPGRRIRNHEGSDLVEDE